MPLYLLNRPMAVVHTSLISRWNAVHNPIRLEFQRKDFDGNLIKFVSQPNSPYIGKLRVERLNSLLNFTNFINQGDLVYIGGSPFYNKSVEVLEVYPDAFIVGMDYLHNPYARFFNLITATPDFHVDIELWDSEKNFTYGTWKGTPNSHGYVKADVSGLLKKQLETTDESDFFYRNAKMKKSYGKVEFRYRETLYGAWHDGGYLFWWTNAAKQIQEKHSGNMAEYVPFNTTGLHEDEKMKFLIEGRPTLFVGYPFDLYWIYPDGFDSRQIERHQQNRDFNGNTTSAELNHTLYHSDRHGVNTLLPAQIDTNATTIDVWLEQGTEVADDGYTLPTFVTPGFTGSINVARPMPTGGAVG